MLDDLNELKTFRAILNEGSLSAAARRLGVTLAVVSKRLATLESRAGARLVQRTTRALSATDEGTRLLDSVERALDAIEAGEEMLRCGRDEPAGSLRVSAPVSFGRRHVAPVLGRLAARYDRLGVSLELSDRLADLVGEGLDVALRIGGMADSTTVMRKLAENRRILAAAPAYLDKAGRPMSPQDAAGFTFLRYGRTMEAWQLEHVDGTAAQIAAPSRLRADGDVIHDWALAGLGVIFRSEVDVAEDIAKGRLERVLPDWVGGETPVVALYSSARHLPLKTRVFLDELTAHLATMIARSRPSMSTAPPRTDRRSSPPPPRR